MNFTVLFTLITAVSVFVGVVLEAVKQTGKIPKAYVPVVSLALGAVVGVALQPFTDYSFYAMGVAGAFAGLSASGGFDVVKGIFVKKDAKGADE